MNVYVYDKSTTWGKTHVGPSRTAQCVLTEATATPPSTSSEELFVIAIMCYCYYPCISSSSSSSNSSSGSTITITIAIAIAITAIMFSSINVISHYSSFNVQ